MRKVCDITVSVTPETYRHPRIEHGNTASEQGTGIPP